MDEKLKKIIDEHWEYVEKTLDVHSLDAQQIEIAEHHYRTAFEHGWKHAKEDNNIDN